MPLYRFHPFYFISLSTNRILFSLCHTYDTKLTSSLSHTHHRKFASCIFIQIFNMSKGRLRILYHYQIIFLWHDYLIKLKTKSSSLWTQNLFVSLSGKTCQNTDTWSEWHFPIYKSEICLF